jgi:hypothetical protein
MATWRKTNRVTGLPQPGLDAAREGRAIRGYVNAKTGIDTAAALTDSTFLTVIPEGKRLIMTCFYMYLSTASDNVTAIFGTTAQESGAGAFTPMTVQFRLDTGTVTSQTSPNVTHFDPPLVVTREDGHAFTAYVQGNDAAAALTLGYSGWLEDITES